ncbi:sushi, von Willebrand factor type A, EGF and pentraxin domain-containing protein 1-like isoform X2 [Biomphalaria glabrata]|uniref:Sushi, von Willebrand factor type A, EGF and pentraxin domain-containing protein 1-like isoform X2 n=1 Tax=Biomphalaria glabrata TaxID=6526 RepID=A0A9W3B1G1_BIOGL|nr:sushi, von Willebrand factor type A, EGF and pentraxin domain-containing protein 1-like isoform X2 [Biomphalaria glabrata]
MREEVRGGVSSSANCVDQPMCSYQASQGECQRHPEDMLKDCPKVCLNPCVCDVSAHTSDTACDCLLKARTGYCDLPQSHQDCPTTCATVLNSVSCGIPPPPGDPNAHLSLTSNSTKYLTIATEVCNDGYTSVTDRRRGMRMCMNDGTWSKDFFYGEPVQCKLVNCQAPPSMQNGIVSHNSTHEGSQAKYSCNTGFVGANGTSHSILTCMPDETWSGDKLDCQKLDCGSPPLPVGTNVTFTSTLYETVASYDCQKGYQYQRGDLTLTCGATGTWQGTLIVCDYIDCRQPPTVPNTDVNFSGTTYGNISTYTCLDGYTDPSSPTVVKCDEFGKWSGPSIACSRKDCGPPRHIDGTQVTYTSTLYESHASYTCDAGFERVDGDDVHACASDGQWLGKPLTCTAVVCGDAPIYPGARLWSPQGQALSKYNDKVYYTCIYPQPGQEMLQWTMECGAQKQWLGAQPQCVNQANVFSTTQPFTSDQTSFDSNAWFLGAGILAVVVSFISLFVVLGVTVFGKSKLVCRKGLKNPRQMKIKPIDGGSLNA